MALKHGINLPKFVYGSVSTFKSAKTLHVLFTVVRNWKNVHASLEIILDLLSPVTTTKLYKVLTPNSTHFTCAIPQDTKIAVA